MSLSSSEKLKNAYRPGQLALKYHPYYRGKIEVTAKCPIKSFDDFAIWYTPGVAETCRLIRKDREAVYENTNKWNTVAIVTDGTRVLGLGDIGPEAGLPVMEGKALLFKYLGGVDAVPVCLATKDEGEIITTVRNIAPSFGGINLEDISQPKCFGILEALRNQMNIPVWHDDQQGTATVVVAGLINALKVVGKKIDQVIISLIGAGAANVAIARLMVKAGVRAGNLLITDTKGLLHKDRLDLKSTSPKKWELSQTTNKEGKVGGIAEAIKGADVCIAMSTPGPGVVTTEMVRSMASDAVVFACANPTPEIWPWEAEEAGAVVTATGRSDFQNQINNSLGFPGIFRGTLDVRARTITDEMCIAAAQEIAKVAEEKGLSEKYIIPTMDEWEVFPREAVAVGMKAIELSVTKLKPTRGELEEKATSIIRRARDQAQHLMKYGFIKDFPS